MIHHEGHSGYSPENVVVLPQGGFLGAVLDFDDTITSPIIPKGPMRGQRLHDVSRVLAAHEIGIELNNGYLMNLTTEQSQESYEKAAEPTLEGSIAYLFKKAGIFSSKSNYDRYDEHLLRFMDRRSALHLRMLKDHAGLNEGAEPLLEYLSKETKYGIAVASMAVLPEIEVVFDKYGLEAYIPPERIFTRTHVKKHKPDREVNDRGLRSFGADISWEDRTRFLGVDDSRGGVESIHRAGMFPIGLATNLTPDRFNGTYSKIVVPSLRDVLRIAKASKSSQKDKPLAWSRGRIASVEAA